MQDGPECSYICPRTLYLCAGMMLVLRALAALSLLMWPLWFVTACSCYEFWVHANFKEIRTIDFCVCDLHRVVKKRFHLSCLKTPSHCLLLACCYGNWESSICHLCPCLVWFPLSHKNTHIHA